MAARKSRRNYRSVGNLSGVLLVLLRSRPSTYVASCLALLFVVAAAALVLSTSRYILLHTKTVAGDNLPPTPWHGFDRPPSDTWATLTRFTKVLACSYHGCPKRPPGSTKRSTNLLNVSDSCPYYFQWIYEDLAPWRESKISLENLKAAQEYAAFRVVIVGGRLYTELYYACTQSRALFTIWGILQLLNRYPGMVPDVDLMFDCMDRPRIMRSQFKSQSPPPPLFRYCGKKDAVDIPFPDWSYWGWAETGLFPWNEELEAIYKGSQQVEWENRHPTAYWKGNPYVASPLREDLLKCNSSEKHDWGAQIFKQDWLAELREGLKNSKISNQCKHRFKIYAEGFAWSVSFKYILGCDSPVLVPNPTYYDFFTRGLVPKIHYWPVRVENLCPSIKFAVDWGNKHSSEAQAIGKAGQSYMRRNVTMDHVYDYMLHLLSEYAKLQMFQPVVPSNAQEQCQASILCVASSQHKIFLEGTYVQDVSMSPCSMPPPDHDFIFNLKKQQWNNIKEVEMWENLEWKKREGNQRARQPVRNL